MEKLLKNGVLYVQKHTQPFLPLLGIFPAALPVTSGLMAMQLSAGLRFCGGTGNLQASAQRVWQQSRELSAEAGPPPPQSSQRPYLSETDFPVLYHPFTGVTTLDLLATLCLRQPRRPLGFCAMRAHAWPVGNLVSNRTHRYFCARLLSSQSVPSLCWCVRVFFSPLCRILHFQLLNFIRSLLTCFSILSRSPWTAAQPSGVSTAPPNFIPFSNLLREHSSLSPRSVMKRLNSIGPSINPWGTPLFQLRHVSHGVVTLPRCTLLWRPGWRPD